MSLLNVEEHLNCFNYDIKKSPKIEVMHLDRGKLLDLPVLTNQVVFLITGATPKVVYSLYRPACGFS